jgi:hypothetical protein
MQGNQQRWSVRKMRRHRKMLELRRYGPQAGEGRRNGVRDRLIYIRWCRIASFWTRDRRNPHHEGMANYCAKWKDYMRELGRLGGLASGERRRLNRAGAIIWQCAGELGIDVRAAIIDDALLAAGFYKEPNRSGGSHESDWRCVNCGHFSSIKTGRAQSVAGRAPGTAG